MTSTMQEAIDSYLAELEREVDTPVEPFGYGTDLSCDSDLREDMGDVAGDTTLALAQALVRRLDCPRGSLPDDPDYGIDVRSYCNRGIAANEVRALAGQIRAELAKDDRVDTLTVTVKPSSTGSTLIVEVFVTPVDARLGGFALTLAVSSAELLIEEIRRAA